ncbi:unnamed protein product [Gongylonema pulchrum]|uniref:Uncharacterized protein n=1 Tax=Gongylonema pulchrum TaxID=637853 RepID=A0A3P6QWQ0_9BILA|nr:unnamed protein product [Gongylonema pulchrum]
MTQVILGERPAPKLPPPRGGFALGVEAVDE